MGELSMSLPDVPPGVARRLLRHRLALSGVAILALFTLVAVAAPVIATRDPIAIDPSRMLEGPSLAAFLGTDALGRDLFTRLAYGARWSLGAASAVTAIVLLIGVVVGLAAGYLGGIVDAVLMRIVDGLLAFPSPLLALAIIGVLGPGIVNAVLALTIVGWASYARVARGLVLTLRERPFVEAARATGATDLRILFRHILPNAIPSIVVLATVEMGEVILALSGLSFLGLGAQPPTPEWGAMLNDTRAYLFTAPRLMIVPGVAITLAVVGLNLVGDGPRDLLDPRLS
jgi:peptide/nickel transport system permease protein